MTDAGPPPTRFLCDAMLGSLARDLRLLGYDVAYDAEADDDELLAQAPREDRILLTRDRELAARARTRAIFLPGTERSKDIDALVDRIGLRPTRGTFLSRCTACGASLAQASSREHADRLPGDVAARFEHVWRCPACDKLYWEGTHVAAIRERLGRYLVD